MPPGAYFYVARDWNFIKVIEGNVVRIALVSGEHYKTFLIDPGSNTVLNRVECNGTGFVQVSFGHGHLALYSGRLGLKTTMGFKGNTPERGAFLPSRGCPSRRPETIAPVAMQCVCRDGAT